MVQHINFPYPKTVMWELTQRESQQANPGCLPTRVSFKGGSKVLQKDLSLLSV